MMLLRLPRLAWILPVALLVFAGCRRELALPRVKRDVVLVTIDTLRFDAVGFDGNPRGTTPNLDRFAAEGRVFTAAHAHNVLTLPSHTNILTGLYPYQHGVRDNSGFRLDRKVSTAATLLSARGFATGAFVAAFVLDSRYGLSRGFETYGELYRHVDVPTDFEIEQSRGEDVVAAALAWYRAREGKPRFLWVHLYDPHAPYDPPEPFRERFADDPYLGEVAYADAALAPLLAALREAHPAPLLIVTADHGEARGDHGELTHGLFAYEPTLHVPMLVWCPDIVGAGRENAPVRHIDILTTILDGVGATAEPGKPGISLLAAHPRVAADSYFESLSANFNRGWAPLRGLLRGRQKYIDLPIAELYDLGVDPSEKENLAASRSDDLRSLKRSLLEIPAGPTDPGPVGSAEAAKLRSLGYLAGGSSERKGSYGPEDDPKNRIAVDRQLHEFVQLVEKGDRDGALRLARAIVAANPRMRMGYEHLAFLLREKGDLAQAVQVLERADANGVGGESLDCRRALLLSEMGRSREAVALLSPYRESLDTETLNALGIALADAGRGQEALSVFARIEEIDPGNGLAYQNAGIALLKLDRAAQARESLQKALAIHDRNPRAWNALGVAWMQLEEPRQAIEAWTKALAYNPKQYDALYNIGLVSARLGDKARAREALERFVAIAPRAQYARDIAEVKLALASLGKAP
jgi:arylsulfatase A-like enzyme/Flp pilus assembly protein TadD